MSSVHRRPLWMLSLFILLCPAMLAAANINLRWDPNPQAVTGYKVYYGSSSQTYSGSTELGPQTSYTMTGLTNGVWYFAVAAVDASGQESALSNEVAATVQPAVGPVIPAPPPVVAPPPAPIIPPIAVTPSVPAPARPPATLPTAPNPAVGITGNAGMRALWAGKNGISLMGSRGAGVPVASLPVPSGSAPANGGAAANPPTIPSAPSQTSQPPKPASVAKPKGNVGSAALWAGKAIPLMGSASAAAATALTSADAIGAGAHATVALPLVAAGDNYMGVAIVNRDQAPATLTFTALDTEGKPIAGVENPVVRTLGPGEQLTAADRQLFGASIANAPTGWIRLESTTSRIGGHYSVFNQDMSLSDAGEIEVLPKQSLVIPATGLGTNALTVANPNATIASASIDIIGADGVPRNSVTRSIAPQGAVVAGLAELFGGTAPADTDYIRLQGSLGLRALVTRQVASGNGAAMNGVDANEGDALVYAPRYAFGKGIASTLSIVNLDGSAGTVALRLFGENAQQVGETRSVAIAPHGKIQISDPEFFGADAKNAAPGHGWVEISSQEVRLAGSVVAGDPGRKAAGALPIGPERSDSVLLANMSSDARFSNGIVIINPGGAEAHATIELYGADGRQAAAATETIPAGVQRSRSLKEWFPALVKSDLTSGYVIIRTDHPLVVFSPLADAAGSPISAIPAQGTR